MKRLLAVLLLLISGPVLLGAVILGAMIPGPAFARPLVSDATISATAQQAQVQLLLSGQPHFHIFYLSNPYRIVIDMDAVDWQPGMKSARTSGLVTELRHGLQQRGTSRLVLDLTSPARVSAARYVGDKGSGKTRLKIEVRAVSDANFRQAEAQTSPQGQGTEPDATAVANFTTAAGTAKTVAAKTVTPTASAPVTPQPKATATDQQLAAAQPAVARTTTTPGNAAPKQVYREPLLTSLEMEQIDKAQEANRDSHLGITNDDGTFITYMHPPGSLLGAGVTVGTSF